MPQLTGNARLIKNEMKKLLYILIILLVLQGCASLSEKHITLHKDELTIACRNNSYELADKFIKEWEASERPIDSQKLAISPEVVKAAYEIFEEFYNPYDIERIGGSEWEKSMYLDAECVIVQEDISINIYDKLPDPGPNLPYWYHKKDPIVKIQIKDFRPRVSFEGKTVLYLTWRYRDILNSFLGDEHIPFATGSIMNIARAKGESEKRQKFLSKKIQAIHGHWGPSWHLITHPYVRSINFNLSLDKAILSFKIIYEGGEAKFRKENGKWKMIESERSWIE